MAQTLFAQGRITFTARTLAFSCVVLVVCLFGLVSCHTGGPGSMNPGETAPNIKGKLLDGMERDLASYKGKVVVLNFWATWCGPCVMEMPYLDKLYSELKDKGLVVLAVNVDEPESVVRDFQNQYGLSFPIMLGSEDQSHRFRVFGFPETFVLDREGKFVLFPDPQDGMPSVRISGPREWNSSRTKQELKKILNN